MRLELIMFLTIGLAQLSCLEEEKVLVKKTCKYPNHTYVCEELFYQNELLLSEVNYTYNGWQVIDSVAYEYIGDSVCRSIYDAQIKDRKVHSYNYLDKDCSVKNAYSVLNDQFDLSYYYFDDIVFLLELSPSKQKEVYIFKKGVIPSIFTNYGVPFNEVLNSFSYVISEGLLREDQFIFDRFTFSRKYTYEDFRLVKVEIRKIRNSTQKESEFIETFDFFDNWD